MIGKAGAEWGIEWHEVNLMDEKVQAESRKINAEAAGKEIENVMVLLEWGAIDQEEAEDRLLGNKILTKKPPEGWWTTMRQHVLAKRTAKGIFDAVRDPE